MIDLFTWATPNGRKISIALEETPGDVVLSPTGDRAFVARRFGTEVDVMFWKGSPVNIVLPSFIEVSVTQSDPGLKGDTSSGATKPATIETGAVIQVPLFVKEGDKLRVDTRTGEYCERVN